MSENIPEQMAYPVLDTHYEIIKEEYKTFYHRYVHPLPETYEHYIIQRIKLKMSCLNLATSFDDIPEFPKILGPTSRILVDRTTNEWRVPAIWLIQKVDELGGIFTWRFLRDYIILDKIKPPAGFQQLYSIMDQMFEAGWLYRYLLPNFKRSQLATHLYLSCSADLERLYRVLDRHLKPFDMDLKRRNEELERLGIRKSGTDRAKEHAREMSRLREKVLLCHECGLAFNNPKKDLVHCPKCANEGVTSKLEVVE
jgi:predicted Zn-ribbon and HTH transcriptional regulator